MNSMIRLNYVEQLVGRVRDQLARRICERHAVLLELHAEFWNLEDAGRNVCQQVHFANGTPRAKQNGGCSVGTIGM